MTDRCCKVRVKTHSFAHVFTESAYLELDVNFTANCLYSASRNSGQHDEAVHRYHAEDDIVPGEAQALFCRLWLDVRRRWCNVGIDAEGTRLRTSRGFGVSLR